LSLQSQIESKFLSGQEQNGLKIGVFLLALYISIFNAPQSPETLRSGVEI
jgi:hypothetical protein